MHSKGGAAVSAAPTKLLETSIDWCTFYLVGALETSAPPESCTNKQSTLKGVQLSPLGFAACQSKNCTNKAICEPLLGWYTPTWLVHLRQVHPLRAAQQYKSTKLKAMACAIAF